MQYNMNLKCEKWIAHLFIMNRACRFCLISSTLFIASTIKDNCEK